MKVKEGYVEKIVEEEFAVTIDNLVSELDAEFVDDWSEEIRDITETIRENRYNDDSMRDEWYEAIALTDDFEEAERIVNEIRDSTRFLTKLEFKDFINRLK